MMVSPNNQAESITYAKDKNLFMRQGVDSRNRQDVGLVRSSEWKIYVDGKEVIVYSTPITHAGPQSFGIISFEDKSHLSQLSHTQCTHNLPHLQHKPHSTHLQHLIEVEYLGSLRSAELLPRELNIPFEQKGNRISFIVDQPCNLVIEANHSFRHPLALFIWPQDEIMNVNDPNVLWFAPGIHEIEYIELHDNQTLYLSQGAIIKAMQPQDTDLYLEEKDWAGKKNFYDFIFAKGKKNIKICGEGIIDTSGLDWHARRSIVFSDCNNITVSGITLIGASHWTMPFFGCSEINVNKVKILGYRENSDGINIVDCNNVLVRGCFIRTGDDAVCVKSMGLNRRFGCSDIIVTNCIAWNDKVRSFGIAGETRYEIKDVLFENCYVLCGSADWTREVGALCIVISDSATIHNITFRKISIRHENNYVINCMIMKDIWSTDMDAGHIEEIIFDDIQIPDNSMIYLEGYDEEHQIKRLHFTNIRTYETGEAVSVEAYLSKNQFVNL